MSERREWLTLQALVSAVSGFFFLLCFLRGGGGNCLQNVNCVGVRKIKNQVFLFFFVFPFLLQATSVLDVRYASAS